MQGMFHTRYHPDPGRPTTPSGRHHAVRNQDVDARNRALLGRASLRARQRIDAAEAITLFPVVDPSLIGRRVFSICANRVEYPSPLRRGPDRNGIAAKDIENVY
jgi:hypothetical protein